MVLRKQNQGGFHRQNVEQAYGIYKMHREI